MSAAGCRPRPSFGSRLAGGLGLSACRPPRFVASRPTATVLCLGAYVAAHVSRAHVSPAHVSPARAYVAPLMASQDLTGPRPGVGAMVDNEPPVY